METEAINPAMPSGVMRMGCLNVRGCGENEKRIEIECAFKERKLDVMVLSETKLKGKGEWIGGVKGYRSGVVRGKAREGVAILMSERMARLVDNVEYINSRKMWVRWKVGGKKLVVFGVYAPGMERTGEEREAFWEELNECFEGLGEKEVVLVLGDMNAKVGNIERAGVVGKFGVPGINANGDSLVEMCAERGMVVGNTWFEKKLINKYTYERAGTGERSLIDYVLWKKDMCWKMEDINVMRGVVGREVTDHFWVEAKMQMYECERNKAEKKTRKLIVNVRKLQRENVAEMYERRIKDKWCTVRVKNVETAEKEWEVMKKALLECAENVCGMKVMGGKKKKNDWWDERVRGAIQEKKELYQRYNRERTQRAWVEYKEKKGR